MRDWIFTAALGILLVSPLAAQQQDRSASHNRTADQQKQADQQQTKSAPAQTNPFPQEQSEKAAQKAQQPTPHSSAAPDQPQPHTGNSTADHNPFPEEQSEKAARQAEQPSATGEKPPAGNQSGSSSQVKGLDLSGVGDSRTSDGAGGTILSPELGRKDTKVGNFYLHSGDYKGAYDRFAEATKVDPTNADAVFGLAEAARHLKLRDEAVSNYQLYISAVPDGSHAKDARRALKELGAKPHS